MVKENDLYQTPPEVWKPLLSFLGRDKFTLDPCSPMKRIEGITLPAENHITEEQDGLTTSWEPYLSSKVLTHVFVNPPYSNYGEWVDRCIEFSEKGLYIWLLLNYSNSKKVWQAKIHPNMQFKLSLAERIKFYINGEQQKQPRYDSVLVHFGPDHSYRNFLKLNQTKLKIRSAMTYDLINIG